MSKGRAIKATTVDGSSPVHAFGWDLPTQAADGSWTPGKWSSVGPGTVQYRGHGIHVCAPEQLGYWTRHLRGRTLVAWVCEYEGQTSVGLHGIAARRVRLLRPYAGEETL